MLRSTLVRQSSRAARRAPPLLRGQHQRCLAGVATQQDPSSTSQSPWLLASAAGLLAGGAAGIANANRTNRQMAIMECTHCEDDDDDTSSKPRSHVMSGTSRVHFHSEDDENLGLGLDKPDLEKATHVACVHCPQEDDDDDDEAQAKKAASTETTDVAATPPRLIPPYVSDQFQACLDNALDHDVHHWGRDAQEGIAAERRYLVENPKLTLAPDVPPPIERDHPVTLVVDMVCKNKRMNVVGNTKYEYWPFGFYDEDEKKNKYGVPGPFIRARQGDVLQVNFTNLDDSGMAHSVDFHSVCGPGGGSPTNFAEQDETKVGAYLLEHPGLYVYHCAAAPIPVHIHNGMFGLILVEPPGGLPKVDKEYYVMQHELYLEKDEDDPKSYEMDYESAARETPSHVLFNGKAEAMTERPCICKQNETIRIYFGNAGPNLVSSFHVIGTVFDRLYREGDVVSPPAKSVQTTIVPAGGAAIVDMKMKVPGTYSIVDHSIFRIDKGAVGMIKVKGKPRPDIYDSLEPPVYCPGCKTHQ